MLQKNITLVVKCINCEQTHYINVDHEDFLDWNIRGKLIQNCFPYLTVDDRELLISKVCGTCFDSMFKE